MGPYCSGSARWSSTQQIATVVTEASVSTQPKTHLTPEQYLAIERNAETRSEYFQGEMYAMSGASWRHVTISSRLTTLFNIQLDGRGCTVGGPDARVHIPATGLYTYPDIAIVCGEPRFQDTEFDTLLNPILIVEILSPSTETYDRTKKFDHYRSIESLREYLLVESVRPGVDLYSRQPDSRWQFTSARTLAETIEIPTLNVRLNLAEIYKDVSFETSAPLRS
jgi:Uma2 family endonuclease